MGRKKLIETDKLIKYIDRFFYEELNASPGTLDPAKIARYINEQGYKHHIEPRIIYRDEAAMSHIDSLKTSVDTNSPTSRAVVFKPLNVDAFIKTNSSQQALKQALIERDLYYSEISDVAAQAINKLKDLEKKLEDLTEKADAANMNLEEAKESLAKYHNDIALLQKDNKALLQVINTYINSAIATELLKKAGYKSSSTTTLTTAEKVEENIITADTNIQDELSKKLLDAFED